MNLRIGVVTAALLLAACSTRQPAPVAERNVREPLRTTAPAAGTPQAPAAPVVAKERMHVVQKGETLIAIALQYGLDYKELAAWNNIENVNLIHAGQELRLAAAQAPVPEPASPGAAVATPIAAANIPVARPIDAPAPAGQPTPAVSGQPATPSVEQGIKSEPRAVKLPFSDKALAELEAEARNQAAAPAVPSGAQPAGTTTVVTPPVPLSSTPTPADVKSEKSENLVWAWPAKGKLIAPYTEASKGIDIAGTAGAAVLAAADGKVMYSGTGIRGYGKLVILKHNNTYLSAYAHNNNILVKEGQDVKKGQKIAEMGSTDTDQVKLHFEIRKEGKPVDPVRILPAQ